MYSFGELPWKQRPASAAVEPTLESALGGQRVVAVAAGSFHSGAVTEDGGVHMWGDNGAGQCGLSGLSSVPNPTPLALLDSSGAQTVPVAELACGAKHSLALSVQREVWAWGGAAVPAWKPQRVEGLAGRCVLQVACGADHSLALVRCLGSKEVQHPPVDKCNQCNQLLFTMTDKEDHVIISDSHFCSPQGEDGLQAPPPAQILKSSPSEPVLPSYTASSPTPAAPSPESRTDPTSEPSCAQISEGAGTVLTNGEQPTPDSDGSVRSRSGSAAPGVKSSPYPDEQAVKEYLRKLSDCEQTGSKMVSSFRTASGSNRLIFIYSCSNQGYSTGGPRAKSGPTGELSWAH